MRKIYCLRTGAVALAAGVLILTLARNAQARWNRWNWRYAQYSQPCPAASVSPSASVPPAVPGGQVYTARYGSYDGTQAAPADIAPVYYAAPERSRYDEWQSGYNQWGSER